MATGPQKYPGASLTHWYQDTPGLRGSAMETNVIVWHSTEGRSLPDYRGGLDAPNITAVPDFAARRLRWFQHHDLDRSSRALRNEDGGVETNTLNVCQVEIVGTCDPAARSRWAQVSGDFLYAPELPGWAIRDLAEFAKWMRDHHGVPLTSDVAFKAYPVSYGASNGVRMSPARWNGFKGHCGHQHVPENLHGDPGAFPMRAILDRAKGVPVVTTPKPEPARPQAYKDVAETDAVPMPRNHPGYTPGETWTLETYLRFIAETLIRGHA